ncbi:hypothetical protein COEREDRAFT_87901 [Coemansia reversa NRRL 1564]|uniref:Uncharacterized protein n=1 Tax=Coemansia reversa (strain ATCC 12441 / NRRL 1564) TaxID=763665 RepID=A0A2G5B912_COERN|nr:hypothetical protein COEREDRAFT_87901 [Coemansia reversa NRRL 1564]|eukprot:PIA15494.1 hypothetical protein COEREDRAFT_87901 [Coemansia reversa NRRL 1564]
MFEELGLTPTNKHEALEKCIKSRPPKIFVKISNSVLGFELHNKIYESFYEIQVLIENVVGKCECINVRLFNEAHYLAEWNNDTENNSILESTLKSLVKTLTENGMRVIESPSIDGKSDDQLTTTQAQNDSNFDVMDLETLIKAMKIELDDVPPNIASVYSDYDSLSSLDLYSGFLISMRFVTLSFEVDDMSLKSERELLLKFNEHSRIKAKIRGVINVDKEYLLALCVKDDSESKFEILLEVLKVAQLCDFNITDSGRQIIMNFITKNGDPNGKIAELLWDEYTFLNMFCFEESLRPLLPDKTAETPEMPESSTAAREDTPNM